MFKKMMSLALALALCLSIATPAFAANTLGVTFSATLSNEEMSVSAVDQEVVVTFKASSAVTIDSLAAAVSWESPLELVSITGGAEMEALKAVEYGTAVNNSVNLAWYEDNLADATDVTNLIIATFRVPANTAAGDYEINVSDMQLANEDADNTWEDGASVTATLTITEPTVEGYTAQITAPSAVTVNNIVNVNIGVGHNSDEYFHAAEIVLEYDAAKLELVESSLGGKFFTNANGVLKFEDFDSEHNFGTNVYTVQFKALDVCNETVVTLSSAKFLNKAVANSSDLIDAASINPKVAAIKVNEVTYRVTLAEGSNATGLTYATEVTKGENLTITAANTNLYTYSISAKIGTTPVDVTNNGDGTYTIAAGDITGDIELTTSRSGREFGVEWTGSGATDVTKPEGAPTYGTDYVFTVPSRVDATAEQAGVTYDATVSIDGSDYSVSAGAGETVTIPGAKIIGDVTIDVTKTELPANGKTVSITGEDVKFSDGTTSKVVSPGTKLTLNLTPEAGYTYSVKIGEQEIMNNNTTTYELTVTDAAAVVVTKTLITENLVTVDDYLTLNSQAGEKLWLVTFNPTLASGKIPTYDGAAMFWSTEYNAYCYLVKAVSLDVAAASSKLGVTTATAENVDYSGNVNKTNLTDAADAQFVANMYNAMYSGIDNNVTMPMFLSADMDGNKLVNIDDANTIIQEKVLNIAAN